MTRAWQRWCAYWEAPGGLYATAMVRVALASSLLWMLWHYTSAPAPTDSPLYYKLGIWMLYPGRPGPALLHALLVIAWISTIAMLLGAWSRASHVVSLVATMAIAAYGVSDSPTWSHTDVPPILASFAFLGARSGDVLAIDSWRRRRRRDHAIPTAHQTSVRLAQLAVACVFAAAAFEKLKAGGPTLGWALSDSLRNHLLVRFDLLHLPRTKAAAWLLGASWRYELVATLNLVSQLTPLAALFLGRHPRLRALAGLCFVAEVLGLGFVMELWNLHWLPLAGVFVDWDALFGVTYVREPDEVPPSRAPLAFATVFVAFFALQVLWLNQRLRAFPFSSFPMFAQVRAKRPYGTHQTYELPGGHLEVFGTRPLNPDEQAFLDSRSTYRWFWRRRDPAAVREALAAVLAETKSLLPALGVTRVRLSLARYQAPAYPAPARLDRTDLAIIGELDDTGAFRTQLGAPLAGERTLAITNLASPPVPWLGAPPVPALYVLVLPRGSEQPWLVAEPRAQK